MKGIPHIEPEQLFEEHALLTFTMLATQLADAGHSLADAEVSIDVTERTDDEVAAIRRLAAERGFTALRLVDDSVLPRRGTVTSEANGSLPR
ncbi:hypothetical protein LTV02_17035 [Nocardia yamanashiensis]|uniref:hypothetical protein n=1 Tax=Nocardia yamanashiensis TaxID=209247 RepID=UPI001E496093|nr:hypothetical protein [Nocardia yamanashiensis]UGT44995.1 hypothetical protein LTV02_17035 [Nocardia yamanashiensis]